MGKGINTTCDEGQTLIPGPIGGVFDGPTHALRADGFDASEYGTGRGTPIVPVTHALDSHSAGSATEDGTGRGCPLVVRRLTPRECERLQGFPDNWTDVLYRGKPAADGPRYKALGNSMAVPVMRYIGERIAAVEAVQHG